MSWLDADNDEIVVRIVYSGPADSGKTTSIRKLAKILHGGKQPKIHTPEEIGGQTMYFDWLDYTGGLFQGKRIRCQILSTPGQEELAKRRQKLLVSADACVFVFNSNAEDLTDNHNYFLTVNAILQQITPAINVVFQANKQDLPEAQDEPGIRSVFDSEINKQTLLLTSAITGQGIREAFVSAVRLALERVANQQATDGLDNQPPFAGDPNELLKRLSEDIIADQSTRYNGDAPPSPAAAKTVHKTNNSSAVSATEPLSVITGRRTQTDNAQTAIVMPFEANPDQLIYHSRHEQQLHNNVTCSVSFKREVRPKRWYVTLERQWKIINNPSSLYVDEAAARTALGKIKKITDTLSHILSPKRWHLATSAGTEWQIWQYVAIQPTLRSSISLHIANEDPVKLAASLVKAYKLTTEVTQKAWQYNPTLHISLDTISVFEGQPYYSGFLAFRPKSNLDISAFMARLFQDTLAEIKQLKPQLFTKTSQSINSLSSVNYPAAQLQNILREL